MALRAAQLRTLTRRPALRASCCDQQRFATKAAQPAGQGPNAPPGVPAGDTALWTAQLLVILDKVNELARGQQELARGQQEVKVDLKELAREQQEMKLDIKQLGDGQQELARGQQEIKVDLKELAREQQEMKLDIKQLGDGQRELAREQQEMKAVLKSLQATNILLASANGACFATFAFVGLYIISLLLSR
jgi:hypothetical protein